MGRETEGERVRQREAAREAGRKAETTKVPVRPLSPATTTPPLAECFPNSFPPSLASCLI